jgi:hypothetical protein
MSWRGAQLPTSRYVDLAEVECGMACSSKLRAFYIAAFTAGLSITSSTSCAWHFQSAEDARERELAIFRLVLDTLISTERPPVVVDPRVLSSDPSEPNTDYPRGWHDAIRFAAVADRDLGQRRAVLQQLGVSEVDVQDARSCNLDGGVVIPGTPPPRGPFYRCVALSNSRPGGAFYPPYGFDRRADAPPDARTVRVVVIGGTTWRGLDVVLEPQANSRWRIIAIDTVILIVS